MRSSLISDPTEHFSKLIYVRDGQGLHTAKHNKYSLQTKFQKPADEYFRKARETLGEFVARVIVLRFLLANQKIGVNQERTCALS